MLTDAKDNPFALAAPLGSEPTAEDGGDDNAVAPEEESDATYEPVVKLEEVNMPSGEEDDDILYKQRAALYRFDAASNEWKERGKGEVKLLQNKTTGRIRALLRQEKTLKLCMNHFVHPEIKLQPNMGSDRSWTWRQQDFAQEPADETFAIRFRDSETAQQYLAKYNECAQINAKGGKASTTTATTTTEDKKETETK